MSEQTLDDQGQTEGEQQAIQMVQLVKLFEHGALNQHAGGTHHHRCHHKCDPVVDAEFGQAKVGHKGAQHVLGAVGEVDDVQQAENHGQAQREQCVKRAVDQPDQQLPEQGLRGYAKDFHDDSTCLNKGV